jgi:hypothetical protein
VRIVGQESICDFLYDIDAKDELKNPTIAPDSSILGKKNCRRLGDYHEKGTRALTLKR